MSHYDRALRLAHAIRTSYYDWNSYASLAEERAFREIGRAILEKRIAEHGITGLKRQQLYEAAARPRTVGTQHRRPAHRNRKARAPFWQVAIYVCDRAYGGPEEGGWWYDCGSRVDGSVDTFYSEQRAWDRCNALNAQLDAQQEGNPRANLGSVLCTGRRMAQVYTGRCPVGYPESTPHYE